MIPVESFIYKVMGVIFLISFLIGLVVIARMMLA